MVQRLLEFRYDILKFDSGRKYVQNMLFTGRRMRADAEKCTWSMPQFCQQKKDRNQAKKLDKCREERKKVRSGMSQKAVEE